MNNSLFVRIVDRLSYKEGFFQHRRDSTGRLGLSTLQKCKSAILIMANGCASDAVDEYLRMGETTASLFWKILLTELYLYLEKII